MLLFSNVLIRVLVQWSMTLMIVPLIAQRVLDQIYATIDWGYETVTTMDEYSQIANQTELTVESIRDQILSYIPDAVKDSYVYVDELIEKVPESVWNSIPLTLLSTILSITVVPWLIFRIDDFFQFLAKRANEHEVGQNKKAKAD